MDIIIDPTAGITAISKDLEITIEAIMIEVQVIVETVTEEAETTVIIEIKIIKEIITDPIQDILIVATQDKIHLFNRKNNDNNNDRHNRQRYSSRDSNRNDRYRQR